MPLKAKYLQNAIHHPLVSHKCGYMSRYYLSQHLLELLIVAVNMLNVPSIAFRLGLSSSRSSNRAPTPLNLVSSILFGVLVVDEQFSVLAEAARQLIRHLDDIEPTGGLVEDFVHLLERTVSGFWVEEVDDWEDESTVDDCEDDVCLVTDCCESRRCDHNDDEVEDPVCGSRNCVGGRSDSKWCDLCWIQPCHTEPSYCKKGVEEE